MSNPFYYLLGLFLALSYPTGGEPLRFAREREIGGLPTPLLAMAAALAAYAPLAWGVHQWLLAGERRVVVNLARTLLRGAALFLYGVLIFVFHLPLWVWSLGFEDNLFFGGLLTLAPLTALFGILSLAAAWAEPRLRGGGTTFRGYLAFSFRTFLGLSLPPVVLMLGLYALFESVEPLRDLIFVYPFVAWLVLLGSIGMLMGLLPRVLRLAFGARPLPDGPLRERLEGVCQRLRFRFSDLLAVGTEGLSLANAFIVGLSIPWRYVFFTDAILTGMTPEQLECVLAHEVMHAKRRHILFYLFFSLGFVLLGALAGEVLTSLEVSPLATALFFLGLWGLVWFIVFGFVSRRFESEADLGAARGTGSGGPAGYGGALQMANALLEVAYLNRVPIWAWSWRHFSIGLRVRILERAYLNPEWGEAFERACRGLRGAAVFFLLLGAGAAGLLGLEQLGRVDDNRKRLEAYHRIDRGRQLGVEKRYDEAARELREGIRELRQVIGTGADDPQFWLWVAECERGAGRDLKADEALAEVRARQDRLVDPRSRLRLEP